MQLVGAEPFFPQSKASNFLKPAIAVANTQNCVLKIHFFCNKELSLVLATWPPELMFLVPADAIVILARRLMSPPAAGTPGCVNLRVREPLHARCALMSLDLWCFPFFSSTELLVWFPLSWETVVSEDVS